MLESMDPVSCTLSKKPDGVHSYNGGATSKTGSHSGVVWRHSSVIGPVDEEVSHSHNLLCYAPCVKWISDADDHNRRTRGAYLTAKNVKGISVVTLVQGEGKACVA